ncbi:hypothetical protein D3C76_873710 [compost metagenome]
MSRLSTRINQSTCKINLSIVDMVSCIVRLKCRHRSTLIVASRCNRNILRTITSRYRFTKIHIIVKRHLFTGPCRPARTVIQQCSNLYKVAATSIHRGFDKHLIFTCLCRWKLCKGLLPLSMQQHHFCNSSCKSCIVIGCNFIRDIIVNGVGVAVCFGRASN